jgi:hypothetical protein
VNWKRLVPGKFSVDYGSPASYFSPFDKLERKIEKKVSNQSMKPTAPLRNKFSVIATTPCRGLSLSR